MKYLCRTQKKDIFFKYLEIIILWKGDISIDSSLVVEAIDVVLLELLCEYERSF